MKRLLFYLMVLVFLLGCTRINDTESNQTQSVNGTCVESWICTNWTECLSQGSQERICIDENQCGTEDNKPNQTQICYPQGVHAYVISSSSYDNYTNIMDAEILRINSGIVGELIVDYLEYDSEKGNELLEAVGVSTIPLILINKSEWNSQDIIAIILGYLDSSNYGQNNSEYYLKFPSQNPIYNVTPGYLQ